MIGRQRIETVGPSHAAGPGIEQERTPQPDGHVDDAWAQLWFSVQRHAWSTLAVVPVAPTPGAFGATRALATAGHVYRPAGVKMIDATKAEPRDIGGIIAAANEAAAGGAQVVIAVDSPLVNPAAIAIARAVDAVVLLVSLGDAELAASRRAIETIGREHFIGSIATTRGQRASRGRGRGK